MSQAIKKRAATWQLTVLLVRQDLKTHEEILGNLEPLVCIPMELPDGGANRSVEARLYYERRPFLPPKWASFFGKLLADIELPKVSSAPAALLVPVDERILALVFSYGASLLEPGSTDPTFGLRVALNSINPRRVRSYDKRSFDALFRQTREQAAKETRLENFGIDAERDLVRTVAGKPKDSTLGSSMQGSGSLRVSTKIAPQKLVHYLRRLYRKSTLETFEEDYPWLGRIEEILDSELKRTLDSYLNDRLQDGTGGMWLAVPEIIDWAEVNGFRFILPSRSKRVFPSLSFDALHRAAREPFMPTVEFLTSQRVELLDADDRKIKQWSLYACLNVELSIGAEAYVLSSGTWYRVDSDLLEEVDRECKGLQETSLPLPPFDLADASEGAYNLRVADGSSGRFCCLDGKNVMFGGGKSRFEVCDLLEATGDLIHVKRYGGSSVLSHLFAQGLISADLLMERPSFRKAADALVEKYGFAMASDKSFSEKAPRTVVYVIIGGPANSDSRELPLFSRVNLRNAARGIRAFDWDVRLQYVQESELLQKHCKQKASKK